MVGWKQCIWSNAQPYLTLANYIYIFNLMMPYGNTLCQHHYAQMELLEFEEFSGFTATLLFETIFSGELIIYSNTTTTTYYYCYYYWKIVIYKLIK